MLKKISAAINTTHRFVRDELILRYPLSRASDAGRGKAAVVHAAISALGGETANVGDVMRKVSLGMTSRVTGLVSDIDLDRGDYPFILDAVNRFAQTNGETIYRLTNGGTWRNMRSARVKDWPPKPGNSGYVELAIVDRNGWLVDRLSVNLWRQVGGGYEAMARSAPVKKVLDADSTLDVRSDAYAEPIDVVYTWVNADDPAWRAMIASHRELSLADHDRYVQTDELKYSIRSLFAFAPWVRKVFIFTNCAPPEWFKPSPRVQWVMHDEVIPEHYLPLFNSHSIETFLHDIPGLSERYIYFNDDVFLSGPVRPSDFFNAYGHSVSRMEPSGVIQHLAQRVKVGDAEEWQCAAVNCANLMLQAAGVLPSKLHCHAPHAYSRTVYNELAEAFAPELEVTRAARFRQNTDFSFSSFLYHQFALWKGKSQHIGEEAMIVRETNYKRFLTQEIYGKQRFFCINDGGGSSQDEGFRRFKKTFLDGHYSFKSEAEL